MNPILKRSEFVADPEAHKMTDGRLYLYGSLDVSGDEKWCSKKYKVFSTDDERLEAWIDHGVIFSNEEGEEKAPWCEKKRLFAPDAIEKDGKYYLYFCSPGGREGVAVSDSPSGPIGDGMPIEHADRGGIDPAVFVDDDGSAYYFWGQFHLRGARLSEDMCSIDEKSIRDNILTEQEHGFHEGASIRKRNGKYYLVFADISRGKASCLSYAMADSPLGPYEKKGVIIDNVYCGANTWNNHGSIEEYKGQWYVFYHRCSQDMQYSRRTCVEKIYFNDDGTIDETEMTSQGASKPISAFSKIDASVACRMRGFYIGVDREGVCGEVLVCKDENIWHGNWAEYKYIDFADGAEKLTVCAKGDGSICVRCEGSKELCTVNTSGDGYKCYELAIPKTSGVKPLWLFATGNVSVSYFEFK